MSMAVSEVPHSAAKPIGESTLFGGKRRIVVALGSCVALTCAVIALSLTIGAEPLPVGDVIAALTSPGHDIRIDAIVDSRISRTIVGCIVGAATALTGVILQATTRNPLVDSGILGLNSGGALAVVVGISVFSLNGALWYAVLAGSGAALATAIVYAASWSCPPGRRPLTMVLVGASVTAVCSAVLSAFMVSDQQTFDALRFWQLGSISGQGQELIEFLAPAACVGVVLALACGPVLNALILGPELAASLGYGPYRSLLVPGVAVLVLTSVAIALAGPISFVGLVAPHIARALIGGNYKAILASALCIGPILLLTADIVGRVISQPVEVQAGLLTALIGAPLLIVLARRVRL